MTKSSGVVNHSNMMVISSSEIEALEFSHIKLPFEQARRLFRTQLRLIEKDLGSVVIQIDSESLDVERAKKMSTRLRNIAVKMRVSQEETKKYRNRIQRRIFETLKILKVSEISDTPMNVCDILKWQNLRLDRVVAEYLLQKGFSKSGYKVITLQGFEENVNFELFEESKKIRCQILNQNASPCLAWCVENRSLIKKSNSPLEFMLRRQEYVELIRKDLLDEAIDYARMHFPAFMEENGSEIEQSTALLAFNPSTKVHPYDWLYDVARWDDISVQFDTDVKLLHGLPEKPQLISLINAGMSALKTPKCQNEGYWESNINCPVCSSPLKILAKKLPLAHLETSVLVCPINGMVMDSDNTPVALPNGHVYSYSALKAISDPIDGKIVCPRSKSVFHISDARKCFIS